MAEWRLRSKRYLDEYPTTDTGTVLIPADELMWVKIPWYRRWWPFRVIFRGKPIHYEKYLYRDDG